MPNGVVRKGDANSEGGKAISGVASVLVNGLPIVVNGTDVTNHRNAHIGKKTANGLSNVIANYKPVNIKGNKDTCAHSRVGASSNVVAGS
jgi:uncharacterized Zn-binding protein involved in type VI secretion